MKADICADIKTLCTTQVLITCSGIEFYVDKSAVDFAVEGIKTSCNGVIVMIFIRACVNRARYCVGKCAVGLSLTLNKTQIVTCTCSVVIELKPAGREVGNLVIVGITRGIYNYVCNTRCLTDVVRSIAVALGCTCRRRVCKRAYICPCCSVVTVTAADLICRRNKHTAVCLRGEVCGAVPLVTSALEGIGGCARILSYKRNQRSSLCRCGNSCVCVV